MVTQIGVDVEQLCADAQEFLDVDPRFWNEDEGAFPYWGQTVYFTKLPDEFILEIVGTGVEVSCPRP